MRTTLELIYKGFRSALPRGERLGPLPAPDSIDRFRSALPRGERPPSRSSASHMPAVSIRAPARGATPMTIEDAGGQSAFRSALPRGERLVIPLVLRC